MFVRKGMRDKKFQAGASAVEYIIGLVAIVGILLAPIPPSNDNVIILLEKAIKKEHAAYVYGSALSRMPDKKRKN